MRRASLSLDWSMCSRPPMNSAQGYFMQWLEGETLGQRIVRSEALAEVRPSSPASAARHSARIHAIEGG